MYMKYAIAFLLFLLQTTACNKKDLLKEKQGTAIIVPTTPGDMQALLDNEDVFAPTTSFNFICSDEFYFKEPALAGLKQSIVNAYLYKDFFFDNEEEVPDWNNAYTQAYYANNVLEGVTRLRNSIDEKTLNPLAGDAYFKRSFAFFNVAQVFALGYDPLTAADEPGIPLRLTINRNEKLKRSSVADTYQQIIDDLGRAIDLLPATVDSAHRNRSNRPAACALLARVYLSMGAYVQALDAAKKSLVYDSLINFNAALTNTGLLVSATNKETLYQSRIASDGDGLYEAMLNREVFVDSTLLREYKTGDLRRTLFFSKTTLPAVFKPGYFGRLYPFTGLNTAEQFLIAAECYARQGEVNAALFYLNKLLESRWKTGQYNPCTAATPEMALSLILKERKKELVFRGVRWTDIRRLNIKDTLLTLSRTVQGNTTVLFPNSRRFALPVPEQVRRFNDSISQNYY
jgi:tetratricopeptide (TPR) repeat protein